MKTSHSFFSSQLLWLANIHWSASEIMHGELLLAMAFKLVLNGKGFGVRKRSTCNRLKTNFKASLFKDKPHMDNPVSQVRWAMEAGKHKQFRFYPQR